MIKVLHLITTLEPAGAQSLLINFAENFDDQRFQISIAYLLGDGELAREKYLDKKIEVIDLTRRGNFDYLVLVKLVMLLRSRRFDIVHTHLVHAGIVGKLAAKLAGVKHLVSTRHFGYHEAEDSFIYRLDEKLSRLNSVVIAISNYVKQYLLDRQVLPAEKIEVVHNAVDLKLFQPNSGPNEKRGFRIGTIGRLDPQKGYPTLLASLQIVLTEIREVELEIIGAGALLDELQALAEEMNIADNCRFLGSLPHQTVIQRLRQWDLFVLSSWWEGFGIVLIEAMALEKAVVATTVEGVVECVEDGKTGFMVPPRSANELAEKIVALLRDEEKREAMGKAGRAKVVQEFSMASFVAKTKQIYESLLAETPTS